MRCWHIACVYARIKSVSKEDESDRRHNIYINFLTIGAQFLSGGHCNPARSQFIHSPTRGLEFRINFTDTVLDSKFTFKLGGCNMLIANGTEPVERDGRLDLRFSVYARFINATKREYIV